jgi:hypothetical protein
MGSDEAIARLIVIDVMWSKWESSSEKLQNQYQNVVDKLLSASVVPGGSGHAYMHACRKGNNKNSRWTEDEEAAVYELPPRDNCGWPEEWLKASDWLARGKPFPAPTAHASMVPDVSDVALHDVKKWGDMFSTRIFMDAACYRTALEWKDKFNYWVLPTCVSKRCLMAQFSGIPRCRSGATFR